MNDNFNFDEIMSNIKEQIKNGEVNCGSLKDLIEKYKELGFHIQKLLEYAIKNTKEDKDKLNNLYEEIKEENIANLCEQLRSYGERLRFRNSGVYERFYDKDKKAPAGMTFRLLELSRLGKRDEVFYIILREFATAQEEVDEKLVMAFNPKYSVESFRALLYSFLSGLLGKNY
uniref:Uncharacterized protein n=1 Tax=Dictyoglomus thermophilum TaxID=14 RepID=A0A7C3RIQ8_DICTH